MKASSFIVFCLLLIFVTGSGYGQTGTWNKFSGGPYNWGDANWTGTIPNSIAAIANLNVNITDNITINLTSDILLDQLTIGDTDANRTFLIQAPDGHKISFNNTGDNFAALIRKLGATTDTISAMISTTDQMNLDIQAGTLIFSGGFSMITPTERVVEKNGGGTLTVNSNTTLGPLTTFDFRSGNANFQGSYNIYRGTVKASAGSTMNLGGTGGYNVFAPNAGKNAFDIIAATTNVGGNSGTTYSSISGIIKQTGGILNFGRDGGASHVALYGSLLDKGNGTLRLQYGSGGGTTNVLGGNAITATGATVTAGTNIINVSGISGGSIYVGMRVYGPGIAPNTVVTGYSSGVVTLSNPVATGFNQSDVPLMFAEGVHHGLNTTIAAANTDTIKVSSTANLNVGDTITGSGIPKGMRIAEIVDGETIRLEAAVNIGNGVTLQTYRPETITFTSSGIGTAGSTVDFLRGSATGNAAGTLNFDPSLNLKLERRAFVNITDNGGTIQDFTFNSLNANSNTTNNTFSNVQTTEGSPFVWFASGQTGLGAGTYVSGPGIPPGARIISVNGNTALLDRAATATGTVTVEVMEYSTIRSEAGNATITVGNYGNVNDVYDGRLDFGSSGGNSRLIKVGSNSLTLTGAQDNSTSRVEVQEGMVILAKDSSAYVHAIGSLLTIGDADANYEIVKLEGTYQLPSGKWTNYNDQIYRTATVTLNSTGILDLNGFTEGFGVLQDSDGIGGIVGNSSSQEATLIVGEHSDTSSTFRGVIRDGTPVGGSGKVNLVKSGGGTLTLAGNNTYTGTTLVSRGTMDIRGPNGALSGTSLIKVANSTLILRNGNDAGGASSNRLNDNGTVVLQNGTLTITNPDSSAINITEDIGNLVIGKGHSILRIQHDKDVSNQITFHIDSYDRKLGSQVSIVENNGVRGIDGSNNNTNTGRGFGALERGGWFYYDLDTPNAAAASSRVTISQSIEDLRAAGMLIGGGGDPSTYRLWGVPGNTPGGYASTGTADKNVDILLGAIGGHYGNQTREFMTVQNIGGVNYIRPLTEEEYFRISSNTTPITTSNTNINNVGRLDVNNTRISANLAFNSLRVSGATRLLIDHDKVLKIGDGDSAIGFNLNNHHAAGMMNLIDWGTSFYGGYIDFGSREILIRGSGATMIQSSLVGNQTIADENGIVFGLIKSGGGHLDFWGDNLYSGVTYVTQGGIRVFNSKSLGLAGTGNGIRLVTSGYDGDTLVLGNGVVIGSLTDSSQREDVTLEYDGRLSAWDQNNVLNGDVTVASATEGGQNITSYLRTRRNSAMLTINGDVINDQTETPITSTFNGGSGRVLALIGDQMNDGIITIDGELADKKVGDVTMVGQYEYEKLNIMVRGGTGDAGRSAPILDFHVNVKDAKNLTGSLDLRSGFFRLLGDYGTGMLSNPTAQGGVINMTMRLRDNSNDYVNQIAVFSMSNNNENPWDNPTVYNVNNITWGDNDNGYSATSYGMLANEGLGKVVIGNGYGSLDMNPVADIAYGGTFSFHYANPANEDPENPTPPPTLPSQTGDTIYFNLGGGFDEGSAFSNLQVGMLVEGAGIPVGTYISEIGANYVKLVDANNAPVYINVTNNSRISFSSLQSFNLSAATQGAATNIINLTGTFSTGFDINNLRPGMLLTGTGIANSTYIMRIDYENNRIYLNKAVTGNPTNIIFNDALPNNVATQRYADARLYAMEGGEIDLRLRLLDEGGFTLENEVGAVTKVGRGVARLSGATGLNGELDGGLNLHGGTLILDYSVNSARKVTSGDNHEAPITLGGGNLHMIGNANTNSVEQLRGLVIMRPGDSQIRVSSGGVNNTTQLTLGPPSNLANNVTMLPVRYAGSSMSFWKDEALGGNVVITLEVPNDYTGSVILPWATWVDGDVSSATYGKVIDFAYLSRPINETDPLEVRGAAQEGLFTVGNNLDYVNDSIAGSGYEWKYGYLAEGPEESDIFAKPGSGFYGTIAPELGMEEFHLRAILFNVDNDNTNGLEYEIGERDTANNVVNIGDGFTLILRSEDYGSGGAVGSLGGAIMISATVGDTHKTIKGGAISSGLETYYFDPDITKALVKTHDLLIHNHADAPDFSNPSAGGGIFTLDTNIVDNPETSGIRLNLVHNGTGWTRMVRATASGPGYSYTGSTFFNGGTVWVSDPNKLGSNPGFNDVDNFYFTGGRLRIADMTELDGTTLISAAADNIVLDSWRGITIGGDGAYIDVAKASTTFTINSVIAVEVHAPTFAGGIIRKSNFGVGDLTKEGLGTLVLTNSQNSYSGRTEVREGVLQVNIGDGVANSANYNPVAKIAADNEEANLYGHLGSSLSYIDGTYVDEGAELRFRITGNTTADNIGKIFRNGTGEWITLDGGTLGTAVGHTGGSLQGMIRVRKDSIIDIIGTGILRFNSEAGMLTSEGAAPGQGALTKIGTGTLELWENNTEFTGNWNIDAGRVVGISQGTPFGTGAEIRLGDNANDNPSANAEIFLSSRMARTVTIEEITASSTASGSQINVLKGDTTGLHPGMLIVINGTNYRIAQVTTATTFNVTGNYPANLVVNGPVTATHTGELPLEYTVDQDIIVKAEKSGAPEQVKKIGARNHDVLANSGMNWDRYSYNGDIQLNDDLIVSYYDDVANTSIGHFISGQTNVQLTGRDQVIALNGNITATIGNDLITEIIYNGDTTALNQSANNKRLRIYFEINGQDNSNWKSNLVIGNGEAANADRDRTHIVRLGGNGTPITENTNVHLTSNSIFQLGGKEVSIGNLMVNVAGVAAGSGATSGNQEIVVENASDAAEGKLRIVQTEKEDWDVEFRNGSTDPYYITDVTHTQNGDAAGQRDRKLNLIKAGGALAVMTQDNDYTGTTEVESGRLQVGRGGTAATRAQGDTGLGGITQGGTTVNSGAYLGGTGRVQGQASTTNHYLRGTLEPGDYDVDNVTSKTGTIEFIGNLRSEGGTLSLQAKQNSFLDNNLNTYRDFTDSAQATSYANYVNDAVVLNNWEAFATGTSRNDHDFVLIQGALTFDSDSKIKFVYDNNTTPLAAGMVFDLLDWTVANNQANLDYGTIGDYNGARLYQGGLNGSFDLPDLTSISQDLLWDLQKFETHGILMITTGLIIVPEPGRMMLLMLALAGLTLRRRRKAVL